MGSFDVATALAIYERDESPTVEPMHGRQGEVRRNPSSDQKKVRRQMTKQAADEANETVPQLLAKAAKATTLDEQTRLVALAEQRTTEKLASNALERSLDLSVKEAVTIVPRGTHELHTEATDWLMSEGLHATASLNDAEHSLVAEAGLWFERVPGFVKEDQEEFRVQAVNKGTYLASQFGEHADVARQAFITETERLYRMGQRTGSIKTAAANSFGLSAPAPVTDVHGLTPDPTYNPSTPPTGAKPDPKESPNQHPQPGKKITTELPESQDNTTTPGLDQEVAQIAGGHDAAGVRGMAEGYAHHQLRGGSMSKAAALVAQGQDDTLAAALAGFDVTAAGGEGAMAEGLGELMPTTPGGGNPLHGAEQALDSTANGVRAGAEGYAQQQLTAASGVPQVGMPADTFSTGYQGYPVVDTSSNRSPALQELEGYQGFDGSSVVPQGSTGAQSANGDDEPTRDFAGTQTHAAKVAAQLTKESSMTDQAMCPTCSGHGVVAVRKQAYSGLPQIDQIVNADETPGQTGLPEDVAFGLTGWGASPEQGQQNVNSAIQQAEGQISERNAKSPLATTGGYDRAMQPHMVIANAPDNSGWMGAPGGPAPGGKGAPYPGYSAPNGYDGSTSTGYVDPVYGQGGDNGNQPLQPYGEMEANDETNNPRPPFDYSGPHNADQGQRTVSPGMSTAGSYHPDPFIAHQQRQIHAAQQAIAARNAQLGG